jgi:hypothetical protein
MRIVSSVIVGLIAVLVSSCAFIRNIPAESTPVREQRYYQTQDMANLAAGIGADLALRQLCHGPTQHIGMGIYQYDSASQQQVRRFRWFSGSQCPVLRVSTVITLGLARRQLDRGYRESGAFMNVYGAAATEILHLLVDAISKHWGPVQ